METTYTLKVVKTEEGITFDEQNTFTDFEALGILIYMLNVHSIKIQKDMTDYEQGINNG